MDVGRDLLQRRLLAGQPGLLRAQVQHLVEQQPRLRHGLPLRPQQLEVHLPGLAARRRLARRARQQRADVFAEAEIERRAQAAARMLRKILAQAQLRIGQQPGREGLRARHPQLVALEFQRRAVRHRQHRRLGRVQPVGGIEAMRRQRRRHVGTGCDELRHAGRARAPAQRQRRVAGAGGHDQRDGDDACHAQAGSRRGGMSLGAGIMHAAILEAAA